MKLAQVTQFSVTVLETFSFHGQNFISSPMISLLSPELNVNDTRYIAKSTPAHVSFIGDNVVAVKRVLA